ncbi:MAG TPA: amidase [Micromonosporaceae bacterium]|jgi:amidase|nr:amidase [Micromonosporaceae bacterium]
MTGTLPASDVHALGRLDATDQAALVRHGDVTATELVSAAIARIEDLNPTLNAVITTTYDRALGSAAAGVPAGPFTGVPYLVKDLAIEVAGVRFTEGSRFLADLVSTTDQELTQRLRRAGLVILGKTNTCEFGMSATVEPLLHGATHNPWDVTRTPGGSSGGSAAAVAAGLVPFAHGNDLGGSIRFPASCCGLFGFKPSRGRNPLGPEYGDVCNGFAVEHALTRSVRDSAALLDATAGPDLGDPYNAPPAPDGGFAAEVAREPGRLRIAYSAQPPGGHPVHPHCVAALDETLRLCEHLGHEVVEAELPGLDDRIGAAIGATYGGAVTWILDYWIRRIGREPEADEIEPYTRALWESGRHISAGDYLLAVTDLQAFARRVAGFFTRYDVWLTPTLAQPPLPLGEMVSTADDPWRAGRNSAPFVAFPAIVANITGAPAMSVPMFWSADGLPIGVHFLGRYGDDATLFRLAGQLERAAPWGNRWPELTGRVDFAGPSGPA